MSEYFEPADKLLDYTDCHGDLTPREQGIIDEAAVQTAAYLCHKEVQNAIVNLALEKLEKERHQSNAHQAVEAIARASVPKTVFVVNAIPVEVHS